MGEKELAVLAKPCSFGPLVKRSRHRPFTAVTRVRFPDGSPESRQTLLRLPAFPLTQKREKHRRGRLVALYRIKNATRSKINQVAFFQLWRVVKDIPYKRPWHFRSDTFVAHFSTPVEAMILLNCPQTYLPRLICPKNYILSLPSCMCCQAHTYHIDPLQQIPLSDSNALPVY